MDRTVLITGCSSGIGHATAQMFHEEDWTVYATARDPDDIAELAEAGCKTDSLDVTDAEEIERVVDRVIEEQGRIDCLVNNAGYAQYGPIEEVPTDHVHAQFDVNVYGPHRLIQRVLPHMREAEEGTIINVSSVSGRLSTPGMGVYCASKFALEAHSDALRNEVDKHGVDVALVEPGPVETKFMDRANSELERLEESETYESIYRLYDDIGVVGGQSPIATTPEAVAETILAAAVAPDPAARYPVGPVASLMLKTRFLPDSIRDPLFGLVFRLL